MNNTMELIKLLREQKKELNDENTRLRAALAQSELPCVYCTLPKEEWSKCKSGFPGCDRADDAMGCPELGARMEIERLKTKELVRQKENILVICASESNISLCKKAFYGLFDAMYITPGAALTGYQFDRILIIDTLYMYAKHGQGRVDEWIQEEVSLKLSVGNTDKLFYL